MTISDGLRTISKRKTTVAFNNCVPPILFQVKYFNESQLILRIFINGKYTRIWKEAIGFFFEGMSWDYSEKPAVLALSSNPIRKPGK